MASVVECAALRCLVLCASAAGVEAGQVLGKYGLTEATFEAQAQASALPLPMAAELVRGLVASGDAGWALRGARAIPRGAMGVLDHLCGAAPTVRACLDDSARFFALVAYGGSLAFDGDALVLAFDVDGVEPERTFVEATFGLLWSRVRAYLGRPDARPLRVEVRAPLDDERRRQWEETVGIEVTGGREANRIVASAELCDARLHGSNAALRAFLEGLALAKLPAVSETWTDRVGQRLASCRPDAELASLAKQLAVSERTLRRRLSDEGTSFSEIRQRELQRRAEAMLSAGNLSHGEIAFALGFSEMSAFGRAFRRWTGHAPGGGARARHAHEGLAATVNGLAAAVPASAAIRIQSERMRISTLLAAATVAAACAHTQAAEVTASTTPTEQALRLSDGRQLVWAQWGDPAGRPAFFFHGGADSRLAAAVIDGPAREAGVRLIAPDRPGYGGSDPHTDAGFTAWPDDVFAIADHLGVQSFSVMGHSAGGPHALAVAADHRGRVGAAIVVAGAAPREAKGSGMGVPFRLNRWLAIRAPGLNRKFLESHRKSVYGDPEKFLRDWGRLSPPEGRLFRDKPAIGQLIIDEMREGYAQGIDAAASDNRALYRDWGFPLSGVEVPVALYYGDADKMAPASWGRYLEAKLPRAELHVVADEGHFSTLVETAPEILSHVR